MRCDQKAANVAIARVIPVILGAIVVYASWAITKQLCIDYLLNPSPHHLQKPRVGAAAGILTVYYILLFPVLACYLRVLHEIIWNPGFVPRGPQWAEQQTKADKSARKRTRKRSSKTNRIAGEKGGTLPPPETGVAGGNDVEGGLSADEAGLESFYTKNVFVCQQDGMPIWCTICCQFKPDRARHCREVDRCVRKMDHFCPWVGGVVCETSFKFFIQFLCYTAIFCGFNLVVVAVYVAELRQKTRKYNVHWLIALGFAALFCMFSLAMAGSSIQFAMVNSTTVENLSRRRKVWTLALSVPRHVMESDPQRLSALQTVSYPFPGEFTTPPNSSQAGQQPPDRRVFAIVDTRPGENPFDLGTRLANTKEVMGYTILEWLLPLKHSPCTDHSNKESAYAVGPAIQRMRKEAGLEVTSQQMKDDDIESSDRRKGRKRRRKKEEEKGRPVTAEGGAQIQEPAAIHHRPPN